MQDTSDRLRLLESEIERRLSERFAALRDEFEIMNLELAIKGGARFRREERKMKIIWRSTFHELNINVFVFRHDRSCWLLEKLRLNHRIRPADLRAHAAVIHFPDEFL